MINAVAEKRAGGMTAIIEHSRGLCWDEAFDRDKQIRKGIDNEIARLWLEPFSKIVFGAQGFH